tara:strand:+ start:1681 stop:1977 length:297 start_codon:yes stop_codon:yes gene_type:complete
MERPETPETYTLNDDLQPMYLVVGYYKHPSSSYYPTVTMYGLYNNVSSAKQRIISMTGNISEENLCRGNNYHCWINCIHTGDFSRVPNAGALDIIDGF